ncbi:MAG: ABC transporter ATP-binding protein/permease [Crocinitomicaceae bacterium]|nr:ABC transporter ATP-binding protein/permease [Crocinitomicaceae bacterium]
MKSLSYLNKYFFKYKWRFLLGILFIVGSNWFKVEMPKFFGDTTDELTKWSADNNPDDLLLYAMKVGGYFLLLSLISGVFLFLTRQTIIIMSRLIEYDLKNEIYKHYQKLNYSFYKKNNTGDLMNRISEDVSHVRMYLGPGIMYTINLAVLSILVILNMVSISVPLTIAVLVPLPIMSFLIYKVASKINTLSKTVQEEQSNMSTIAQETFTGIRVIKAYSRLKEANSKFAKSAENYKGKSMRLVLVNSFFMPTIFLLIGVSTIICIYLGGLLYYDKSITPGNIMTFIFYVNMLTWPFASIGWVTSLTQRAAASQGRINEFLQTSPEIVNNSTSPFNFQGGIEFKNVSYTYANSGIQAIKNLSFKLEKGQTLGVVGRTGSGKSTILKLLMRQIDPDNGEILIDGVNIKDINMEAYRDQTGIVPQEVFLFSDTIKNNLEFGSIDGNISEERLIEVTKLAHVYHNISEFQDKFETLLGERGVNLSGGQKQRLSIARALIRNPKLLILDDCLSAVDTETEEIILDNLKKTKSTTSLVVSHRISSIRNASQIINIEDGSVTEYGTHQELMSLNGIYEEMYKKQLTEENA